MKAYTNITIKESTKLKLKQLLEKTESWDSLINRLCDDALYEKNVNEYFFKETLTIDEALKEIDNW